MSIKTTAVMASVGLLLASTNAMADDKYNNVTIDQLPDKGEVTISGSVDDIDGSHEFDLRDGKGKTIEVESDRQLNLREGDRVTVTGMVDNGFLGIGKEIDATHIRVTDRADEKTPHHDKHKYKTRVDYEYDKK